MTVECGSCRALLKPGAAGRCCVAWSDAETIERDRKTIRDLASQVKNLRKRNLEMRKQLTSKYPLFPNPWPNGVTVVWHSGRGWVPA